MFPQRFRTPGDNNHLNISAVSLPRLRPQVRLCKNWRFTEGTAAQGPNPAALPRVLRRPRHCTRCVAVGIATFHGSKTDQANMANCCRVKRGREFHVVRGTIECGKTLRSNCRSNSG